MCLALKNKQKETKKYITCLEDVYKLLLTMIPASMSYAIAWNSLPDSIKKSSSLECFKKRLRSSKDLINSISYNKESSMIRNRNEEFLY